MSSPEVLAALKEALDRDPRNGALWIHYAGLLEGAARRDEAIAALRTAIEIKESRGEAAPMLVRLLRETGQLAEALIRAEALLEERDDPELEIELGRILEARGEPSADAHELDPAPPESSSERDQGSSGPPLVPAAIDPEGSGEDDWVDQFEWGDLRVTFGDVAGLDDVKRQIELRIIAPFKQPEIYQAFGREGGGGLLLYGPPGCGKTFIARATAGELAARFVSIGIHDIVDKYWGESEKLVHALFEDARRKSPTVLFFDEFDALGSTRARGDSQFWKVLVDQLLQEMDGIRGKNTDVLLFAATNMPWNVDSAFRRPGRFDRVLFVTPPDAAARRQILERRLKRIPGGGEVEVAKLVKGTALFTGADLVALCERATERALERSLSSGSVEQVRARDFDDALRDTQSSAREWFATARNYARYSNDGGQYDDLVAFLRANKLW